ncbi:ATP-binding protein [Streptomyces sp. NPDC057616]|uniref:ATP-binding protein n=1 Tax=Streptomyces sp. NPDC057616 TaxID=3346183 RepID=UPI00367AB3F5
MTLAGRSTALTTLGHALRDCAEGCSRTVLVEGGAGCGKSALVHRLIEQAAAAGAEVRCASAGPADRDHPSGVVGRLTAGRPTPVDRREFTAPGPAGRAGALVLCVEDVQHADAASRAFLHDLARARPAATLLAVTATTAHDGVDTAFTTGLRRTPGVRCVPAPPLGPAPTHELAARAGRGAYAALLHEVSGGNPLLLHALLAEHHTGRPGAPLPPPAPDGPFTRAVHACLHRAGPAAGALARAAALRGGSAAPAHLTAPDHLTPPVLHRARTALRAAGLLDATGHLHPAVTAAILTATGAAGAASAADRTPAPAAP